MCVDLDVEFGIGMNYMSNEWFRSLTKFLQLDRTYLLNLSEIPHRQCFKMHLI